jgi:hypothetical protein
MIAVEIRIVTLKKFDGERIAVKYSIRVVIEPFSEIDIPGVLIRQQVIYGQVPVAKDKKIDVMILDV